MKNIVENIINSYEAYIQSIGAIFDTTGQLLEGFHASLLDTEREREKLSTELRESLSKNKSLRKKDFDSMMQEILSNQDEREKEVRDLLKTYLNEQKKIADALRKDLATVTDTLAKGQAGRVKKFQDMVKEILGEQDERKQEVTSELKEFLKGQNMLARRLKGLLAKGKELRIKDLKLMLAEFKRQHKEWITHQEESKEEIRSTPGDFKKERLETEESRRIMQKQMPHRRTVSPAAVNIGA